MDNLQEVAAETQVVHLPENLSELQARRKVGVEIVRSAELSSRFFRGWLAASCSLRDDLWMRRLADARAAR